MSQRVTTSTPCPACEAEVHFNCLKPLRLQSRPKWIKCKNCNSQFFLSITIKNQGSLGFQFLEEKITAEGRRMYDERKQTAAKAAKQKEVENAKSV